ncbi:MAG: hypothetical protein GX643_08670 [Acidimicrobiales bacterium]|nr:hypothetical protein [Acidimicrobiales bacterium]
MPVPVDRPNRGQVPAVGPSERWRWFGQWWFLLAVATLGLNDHLLKARFPGWWTGKASDVAGVVVVATVGAFLLGPVRGTLGAGFGFVVLKTVPGVAELAAPFLGGSTLRDPTDLIALVALIPVFRRLRRVEAGESTTVAARSGAAAATSSTWRRTAGSLVPLLGALTAVFLATATGCGPDDAVVEVSAEGDVLYALVARGFGPPERAVSTDGGRTWTPAPDATSDREPEDLDPFADGPLLGPLDACADDGICYRLRDQQVIERRTPGSDWIEELTLTPAQRNSAHTGCRGGARGTLASIAIADAAGAEPVVSFGAQGVLVRNGERGWRQVGVLDEPQREAGPADRVRVAVVILAGPVLALGIWLGRARLPGWRVALAGVLGGSVLLATGMGVLLMMDDLGSDWGQGVTRLGLVGAGGLVVVGLALARWTGRSDRRSTAPAAAWSSLPPPPPPPPPPPGVGESTGQGDRIV